MEVCLVNAAFGAHFRSVTPMLDKYRHIPSLARALARRGHGVTIVQAFSETRRIDLDGIVLQTVAAGRPLGVGDARMRELSDYAALMTILGRIRPDVIHLFSLVMYAPLRRIAAWSERNHVALTVSFHGGRPPRSWLRRQLTKRIYRNVHGLMFSAPEFAAEWREAGILRSDAATCIVPEVSSEFTGIEQEAARQALGIERSGHPVFAWSGRLVPVKDPITAIEGFRLICQRWPQAMLLMAFQSDELLGAVRRYIGAHAELEARIRLLGSLPHARMETVFSAADFFLQSSLREYGSNSLVEALACGAIPLVSDIAAFRALTAGIDPACLFGCGDPAGLAASVAAIRLEDLPEHRARIRLAFASRLSYAAMAEAYESVFATATAAATDAAA